MKARLAASMCSTYMQELQKILDKAQHLQRLQTAPGSFATLAVQLQGRDHQQGGSDSRRCPRLVFMQSPKDRRSVQPVHRSMKVWSKFGQSLLKFCSQTAAKLAVPTDDCRNAVYSTKLLATFLHFACAASIASVDF